MAPNPAPIPVQAMTLMTVLVHVKGRKRRNGGNALALAHAVAVAALIAATQTLIEAERGDIALGTPLQITRGRALSSTGTGREGRVGKMVNIEKEVPMMTGEMMRRKWEAKEVIPPREKQVKKKSIGERRRKCIGTSIGIGAESDQGIATEYDPVISEKANTLRKTETETEAKKRLSDVKPQGVEKGILLALLLHPPLHLHLRLHLLLLLPHINLLKTKSAKPPPKNHLYHQHHHH